MIYQIGEYPFEIPERTEKYDLLFADKPKEEQYWIRQPFDFEEINKKWTDEKKIAFVNQELFRFRYGLFFMNNGEEVYITGSNYRFLQYWLIPTVEGISYPTHRKYQREFFYFLDFVVADKYCEGAAVSKPRRVGCSASFNCFVQNMATIYTDKKMSIQNKTRSDAIDVNYEPIRANIDKFPSVKLSNGKEIFRPQISKLLTAKALFGKEKKVDGEVDDSSNNHIYVVSTVENADDGKGSFLLIRDEISKYPPDIDISNMFKILKPTAKVGSTQFGKIMLFGTSAERSTENFERWKIIYFNSDYTNRTKRKTVSGLYKYFISGKYSIEGTVLNKDDEEVPLFNMYGECNEDLAVEWIEDQRRPFRLSGDTEGLQAVNREYPIYETDAFNSSSGTSCYDTVRLSAQLYEIEKKQKSVMSGIELPFFTIGDLEWIIRDREVRFTPNPFGHWKIIDLPDERWKNKNSVDRYNFLTPQDDSPYLWTADPTAYREQVVGGSKGAIIVGSCIDANLKDFGGKIHARFNHRPNHPNEFLEEVRKAAIFYSARGLPENNREWLAAELISGKDNESNNRFRLGKFLLIYENGKFRVWRSGDKIAGISSQEKSIEAYVRSTANYLAEPKEGEFDYLKTVWDDELIRQWMNFDRMNTQKFDLAVTASMYCMLAKTFNRIIRQDDSGITDAKIIRMWFGIKDQSPQTQYNRNSLIAP